MLSTEADKTQHINPSGNVADLISWMNNPTNDTQRWHIIHRNGTVIFLNKAGGRAIGILNGNASAGIRLAQWVDDIGSDKSWKLVATSDGYSKVQSAQNSSLYMTGATANAGPINLQTATTDGSSEWQFVRQAPTASALVAARTSSNLAPAQVSPGGTLQLTPPWPSPTTHRGPELKTR